MNKRLTVIALCCMTLCSQAQLNGWQYLKKAVLTRAPYDSNFVDSYYRDFLHVTLISISQNHDMEFSNNLDNVVVRYRPNNSFTFGIGLDYRIFSLEYTTAVNFIDRPDPELGKSDNFSLRLGITGRRFLGSTLIQSHKGMYVTNPSDIDPTWNILNKDKYPVRPDVLSELALGSLNYMFNHKKYSTMASLWQIDRQKRSAGSFIVGVTASISHIKGDSSLVPSVADPSFPTRQRIVENYNYLGGLNAGYGHNFIFFKYFFINMLAVPGVDLQFGKYKGEDGASHNYNAVFGYHADVRLIGGYNGIRYYGGAHYSNYFLSNRIESDANVNLFNSYFRIFFGRRFDISRTKNQKK